MLKNFFMLLFITIFLLIGCQRGGGDEDYATIYEIAFDVHSKSGYTIYVKENSMYTPYIVISGDYNGSVLLLRKELLDEPQKFNEYSSYYEDSLIDTYINGDFFNIFSDEMKSNVMDTTITITDESSLGICGETNKSISRNVFLLSFSEVGFTRSSTAVIEGDSLKYFKESKDRITYKNNVAGSWWLRTPDTSFLSCPFGIGPDGSVDSGNAYNLNGIRPAFCVDKNLKIVKSDKVLEEQKVYIFTCEE